MKYFIYTQITKWANVWMNTTTSNVLLDQLLKYRGTGMNVGTTIQIDDTYNKTLLQRTGQTTQEPE
jgi:hypothetical protein